MLRKPARTLTPALLALALLALGGCRHAPHAAADPASDVEALLDAGRRDEALTRLERALQRAPDDPQISIRIGEIELERGNPSDAYVAFRRAAELAPDEIRAVSGLALAADALGFDDEAAAAYARWSELERAAASPGAGDPGSDPW